MKKLLFPLCLVLILATALMPGCDLFTRQLPVVNSFDANPPSISAGGSSTLTWNISGAASVSIDQGIGNVALTGSRAVAPSTTTTYTLTATNASGSITTTCQVMVAGTPAAPPAAGLPVISSFTASPPSITAGSSVTLSWNVSNATSVTIDQGVGAVASVGTTSVVPTATTNYILMAINAAGKTVATTQVTVTTGATTTPNLPVINFFNANPASILSGGSSTLTWNVSNATSVTIEPGIGAVSLAGSRSVSPTVAHVYMLTATNTDGSVNASVTVLVSAEGPSAVTKVQAVSAPGSGTRPCPFTINYTYDITTNGPGTVTYHFEQSNGATSSTRTLNFAAAGTQTVSHTWAVSGSGTYSVRCRTLTPNDMSGNSVPVTVTCEGPSAVTKVQAVSAPGSGTRPCPFTINYTYDITTNGPGTVTYHFEQSNGATSSTRTLNFAAAGTQTVSHTWPVSGSGTYSVRCRTLTPNDMSSNSVPVTVTCEIPFAVTSVSLNVNPQTYAGLCPSSFTCAAIITVNGPGTVTYRWEASDITSAVQTLRFDAAGSQAVTSGWNPPTQHPWVQVHILSPNDKVSFQWTVTNLCHY